MAEERTVYIIGAGFSHGYDPENFPLMNDMFNNLDSVPEELKSRTDVELLKDILNMLYGDLRKADIEEVLAYCDIIENGPIYLGEAEKNKLLGLRLSGAIKSYLTYNLFHAFNENESYGKWIKSIKDYDAIITFNYDLLIEWIMINYLEENNPFLQNQKEELSNSIDLMNMTFDVMIKGRFLKLHGSILWYVCTHIGCRNHTSVFSYANNYPKLLLEQNLSKYKLPNYCRNCSSPLDEVIIYPGMYKRYEKFPKIQHLWNLAGKTLKEANRIIVIGYSFREQDIATSFLIKSYLMPEENKNSLNWIVVDPYADKISRRLIDLLPARKSEITYCQTYENLTEFMSSTSK